MASMVRPSLILKMNLDEHVYSDETVADIKRSYSYVAPSIVERHATGSLRPENTLRFMVKLHRPYWDANDAAANELWDGVMPKWMRNLFCKVSSTIIASNKVRTERGEAALPYAWLELEFGDNATLALKTASDSSLPEAFVGMVGRVRELAAQGAFGDEKVACVRIPSRASYEAQLAAALGAAESAGASEGAEGAAGGDGSSSGLQDASLDGEPGVDADPAGGEASALDGDGTGFPDGEPAAQGGEDVSGEDSFAWPELPAFDIDYSIWGIEYANGSVRTFNSAAGAFEE